MNILLIVGNYYPKPSSVANCVNNLISMLQDERHTISLVTNSADSIQPFTMMINNAEVIFITDYYSYYSQKIDEKFKRFGDYFAIKYLRKLTKLPIYLRYYLFAKEVGMVGWYTRKNARICWRIFKNQQINMIISFSHPFSAHYFANNLSEGWGRQTPWILFEFDPYAYNDVSSRSKLLFRRHKKQEADLFSKATRIIVTPELFEFYRNSAYKGFIGKMFQLPYILLQEKDSGKPTRIHSDGYLMVYAGSFYTDIRNPLYAIEVIGHATNGHTLLITNYNEQVFRQTISRFPGKFEVREMMDQDSIFIAMEEANIFISVGNTIEIQVPAKIFEYMGLGKPIIHFCKTTKDPALKYLSRYPMALIINEFEVDVNGHANQIDEFLREMKGKEMNYKEVKRNLSELDYKKVEKKFLSIVESVK